MKIIYASTSKEDAENQAEFIKKQALSVGKPIKLEVKKEGDRYCVYSNGKIVTRTDVVYFKEDLKGDER